MSQDITIVLSDEDGERQRFHVDTSKRFEQDQDGEYREQEYVREMTDLQYAIWASAPLGCSFDCSYCRDE